MFFITLDSARMEMEMEISDIVNAEYVAFFCVLEFFIVFHFLQTLSV